MVIGNSLDFKFVKRLGSGGFSNIDLVIDCENNCHYAMKTVNLDKASDVNVDIENRISYVRFKL